MKLTSSQPQKGSHAGKELVLGSRSSLCAPAIQAWCSQALTRSGAGLTGAVARFLAAVAQAQRLAPDPDGGMGLDASPHHHMVAWEGSRDRGNAAHMIFMG